jgi:hypothetical protein
VMQQSRGRAGWAHPGLASTNVGMHARVLLLLLLLLLPLEVE